MLTKDGQLLWQQLRPLDGPVRTGYECPILNIFYAFVNHLKPEEHGHAALILSRSRPILVAAAERRTKQWRSSERKGTFKVQTQLIGQN